MSKLFILIGMAGFLSVACSNGTGDEQAPKSTYEAPDFGQEVRKIDREPSMSVPDNADTATQLMYVLSIDKTMKSMMLLMQGELTKVALAANEELDHEYLSRANVIMMEEIDIMMPDLVEDFAQLYRDEFTDEELKEILLFYQSPIGKKLIERQSVMMIRGAKIGERMGEKLAIRLMKRADEFE